MTSPLYEAEAALVEAAKGDRVEQDTRKRIAEANAQRLRDFAAKFDESKGLKNPDGSKMTQKNADDEAVAAAKIVEAFNVPATPRILADDVTPEAAGSLMAEQGGRLAIISAEGGIFDLIAGRYNGNIPNMDLWLKAHVGDPFRVDRKGRDPEYVKKPALTMGLMLQPSILTAIGRQEVFRGRGFLARFLYAEPKSKVGQREAAPEPVPDDTESVYRTLVRDLATGLAAWGTDPAVLLLDAEAKADVIRLLEETEPQLAEDGLLGHLPNLAEWGGKYVGAVLRIAGLLHLAEHGAEGFRTPVTIDTLAQATRIGAYFKQHAIKAFNTMSTDSGTADAIYLLRRVAKTASPEEPEISFRDMHVATRTRFKKAQDLDGPVCRLIDHGYLAPLPQPEATSLGGRPKSPRYRIHPHVWEQVL